MTDEKRGRPPPGARRGARGRFTRPEPPGAPPPAPPGRTIVAAAASPASPGVVSARALSSEPTAEVIEAVLAAIKAGEFTADAFVTQGIPWATAVAWLRVGEASVKLAAEDPRRSIDWRGALYQRVQAAVAESKAPIMRKLRTQAESEGGVLAVKYMQLRHGDGASGGGGTRAGRDYQEQEAAAGGEGMTDEDVLAMIDTAIASALEAASAAASSP